MISNWVCGGGPDLWYEGRAERIEYDERTDVVKLFSKAMIRQLEGQDVTHQMDDAFIAYDQRATSEPRLDRPACARPPEGTSSTPAR
jgi:hypothetical protein